MNLLPHLYQKSVKHSFSRI